MPNLNIYNYVPWAFYKLIPNNMFTCEYNGINETNIRINDQDDQIVLIKNH